MSPEEIDPVWTHEQRSPLGRLIRFCLENRLIVMLLVVALMCGGLLVAPFQWKLGKLERYPVAVDAIPDIGENQQIVFTQWMGRSPQDVEDQIGYPLTVALSGVPGVKTVRSYSMFGFSSIYIIFKEDVEFYWSRTRVLEKLNSLPSGTLPPGVSPSLGPDATALGQIFWYTLEGRDEEGNVTSGWGQEELRTVQDWYTRYALLSAEGVSEVASIGGYVKEYQVDVDPDALRNYGVSLDQVYHAVMAANIDVGARTLEINRVEYFVRGIGFIRNLEDIRKSVVAVSSDNVPILVENVATVQRGPAARRGVLDKGGASVVGGVVVARYGANPLEVINAVKEKIDATTASMPEKVLFDEAARDVIAQYAAQADLSAEPHTEEDQRAWLAHLRSLSSDSRPEWATISKVTVVPFYDRTGLIYETLGTLNDAIGLQILVTMIVVMVMVMHLRSSLLISSMLPLAVLLCFIAMKLAGVQANIVALSGIVIAIGTIVDVGIVVCENILRHLGLSKEGESSLEVVHRAASEVGGAVLTAVLTTVVSFLPVFAMIGAEGKLFKPLAYTKTFALLASIVIALTILPPAAHALFCRRKSGVRKPLSGRRRFMVSWIPVLVVSLVLSSWWEPLGPEKGLILNLLFVVLMIGGVLLLFYLFLKVYEPILRWCLKHKLKFLCLPLVIMLAGALAWRDLGKEFMPQLDEGSFLWMPTTMTHASMGEALDILATQDRAFEAIPEIDTVVGKLGRADSPLDPAPISMIETVINYKPEFRVDENGRRIRYRYDRRRKDFARDENGQLIPDRRGRPFRQWREHIQSPDDIWDEIVKAAKLPGTTSAPKLQPIAARLVMMQSGMRAPMGVKIKGADLETIEAVGLQIEKFLKQVPSVQAPTVIADRIVGKPYIEIHPDRESLARYGVPIRKFQDIVEIAIGGKQIMTTIEGRERYPVRVRYQRELRDNLEALEKILVAGMNGQQIPLGQLAEIRYVRGPQVIKSEDTFLVGYVVFDMKPGHAEVDVVEECQRYLSGRQESGEWTLPRGISYEFAGNYENQQRATQKLAVILPLALFLIFMLIYLQFKKVSSTLLVFSGIFVAWSGGFLLVWLYGQPWFMDFSLLGVDMRSLFQIHTINMSVAVWVGFLALFGIATDDGVIISTYIKQTLRDRPVKTVQDVHEAIVIAGKQRVRPCLMTSATTILALLPVLTSTGRGSDVMVPMAIPSFGGMCVVLISIFMVPVLYAMVEERKLRCSGR